MLAEPGDLDLRDSEPAVRHIGPRPAPSEGVIRRGIVPERDLLGVASLSELKGEGGAAGQFLIAAKARAHSASASPLGSRTSSHVLGPSALLVAMSVTEAAPDSAQTQDGTSHR